MSNTPVVDPKDIIIADLQARLEAMERVILRYLEFKRREYDDAIDIDRDIRVTMAALTAAQQEGQGE